MVTFWLAVSGMSKCGHIVEIYCFSHRGHVCLMKGGGQSNEVCTCKR